MDELQRKAVRDALIQKYQQASQDNSEVEAAQSGAKNTAMLSGLGEALSGIATAGAQSRGAARPDMSIYQGMRDRAKQAIQQAIEAKQGKIKSVQGEIDNNNQLETSDRAQQALGLQESNQKADNALGKEKLNFEKSLAKDDAKIKSEELDYKKNKLTADTTKEMGNQGRKESMDLGREYRGHPVTKETDTVESGYKKIKGLKPNTDQFSAADDMALIYGFMKMQDPGSTVREGEYAQAEQTRGIPEHIRAMYNKAKDGEKLSPQQRKEFITTAESLRKAQIQRQGETHKQYSDTASRYSLDPVQAFGDAPQVSEIKPQIDPQDQAAIDWVKANPQDPRAAQIMEKLKAKGY